MELPESIDIPDPADPEAAFGAVVALRRLADRLELAAANAALDQGWSWADIAEALGVTKQAAHQKLAKRIQR